MHKICNFNAKKILFQLYISCEFCKYSKNIMRYEILNFNFTLLIWNIDKSNLKYFIFQDQYYSDKWNKVNDKKT